MTEAADVKPMRFTKIKYDGSKVRLEWEKERADGSDPDEFTLFSADKPLPSFEAAMDALTPAVVAICEFEEHQGAQIDIRGVTVTWTNDIMGACITALKRLTTANAPLVINTPHLPSEPYSDGNPAEPVLPVTAVDGVRMLIVEAERYVNGERAQASLFTETAAA